MKHTASAECLDCGRTFVLNADGKIHGHRCVKGYGAPSPAWQAKIRRGDERRASVIAAYADAPLADKPTLDALGAAVGVTRERARQYLRDAGFDVGADRRAAQDADRVDALRVRFVAALEAAMTRPPCVVCGGWVISTRHNRTCSRECARRWNSGRYAVDDQQHERHRMAIARSILNHPENRKPSQLDWARRMLGPNPPPPNRRYAMTNRDLFDKARGE